MPKGQKIDRKSVALLLTVLFGVAVGVLGNTIWTLYRTGLSEHRDGLVEMARSQASMIQALLQHTQDPNDPGNNVLQPIIEAQDGANGFGKTGEFVLARLQDGNMIFLTRQRFGDKASLQLPFENSGLAEPMRRAFQGLSGTLTAPDYRGVLVLAAHEPIIPGVLGIVAKKDISELQAPYLRAAISAALGAIGIMAVGLYFFRRIGNPIIRHQAEILKRMYLGERITGLGHWYRDLATKEVWWSGERYRILGIEEAVVPASLEAFLECVHPDDRKPMQQALTRAMAGGDTRIEYQYRIRWPDGAEHIVSDQCQITRDADGNPIRLHGTSQDITELTRAETSRRDSEERFRSAFENISIGAVISNVNNTMLEANLALCEMLDYSEAELLTLAEIAIIHPDDVDLAVAQRSRLLDQLVTSTEQELRLIRKDGETAWATMTSTLIASPNGAAPVIISHLQDISMRKRAEQALRRSEEHFRGTFEATNLGAAILDADDKFVDVNLALADMLGLQRDALVGKGFLEITLDQETAAFYGAKQKAKLAGRSRYELETRLITNQNGPVDVHIQVSAFQFGDRRHAGSIVHILDITDRKEAERQIHALNKTLEQKVQERTRKLVESEKRLRGIMDSAVEGIVTISRGGLIQSFNTASEEMFGYKASEVIGKNVRLLMPSPDRDLHHKYLSNYLRTNAPKIIGKGREVTGRRKDGHTFPMDLAVSQSQAGEKIIFTGFMRDLTALRSAEKKSREVEEHLSAIINNSPALIFITDTEHRFLMINNRFEATMGITFEEIKGKFQHQLFDPDLSDIHVANNNIILETKAPMEFQETSILKDGVHTFHSLKIPLFNDLGEVYAVCGIATDITDRKKMEEALRDSQRKLEDLAQIAPVGVFYTDADGAYQSVNKKWREVTGLSEDEARGDGWLQTVHPDDRTMVEDDWRAFTLDGTPMCQEYRLGDGKSQIRWVWTEVAARTQDDGKIISFVGIITDITDRKSAEEGMSRAKEIAEAANSAKSGFLSSMSHELRTPLNAILGFSQLLESDSQTPLTDKQGDMVRHILESGQHLQRLVDEILDLAMIESGNILLRTGDVLVENLIAECVSVIEPLSKNRCVTCENLAVDLSLPPLKADKTRLKQIIINLLSNGIKYNRPGGSVKISAESESRGRIRISVEDTGRGIPEDLYDRIFQPFQRLEAQNSQEDGSGIGLTICKRLVELMGGEINFKSVAGEGSVFWFELPCDVKDGKAKGLDLKMEETISNNKKTWRMAGDDEYTLLYVEDNPINLSLMEEIVSRVVNLSLLAAENGELGIEFAKRYQPDVILMDINLPGMDGIEAMKRLRRSKATQPIPVIALSAHAMPNDIAEGLEAGFREYLSKPIDVDQILSAIEGALTGAPAN